MLKRIAIADLRLGMYLERFEGAWVDHPFWRTRFVFDQPADLQAAQASGLQACWIDVSRGLDVAPATTSPADNLADAVVPRQASGPAAVAPAPVKLTPMADELERAAALLASLEALQAEEAVSEDFVEPGSSEEFRPAVQGGECAA